MRVKIFAAIVGLVALSLTGCAAVEQPSPEPTQEESRPMTQPIDPLATKEPVETTESSKKTAKAQAYLDAVMPGAEALEIPRNPDTEAQMIEYGYRFCGMWAQSTMTRDEVIAISEQETIAVAENTPEMTPAMTDYFVKAIRMASDHLCPVG